MLIDHANCEKKAASTALNLMYRYVEQHKLLTKLSRLGSGRVASLRAGNRHHEEAGGGLPTADGGPLCRRLAQGGAFSTSRRRLVDTLLIGAIIEARSCERFACTGARVG